MWFLSPISSRKKRIYLDHASATPVAPEALAAMNEAMRLYGNPGAIHEEGVEAKEALARARETIARELACKARELVFVSGGTEANNLAILGRARRLAILGADLSKTHWVVSAIEHPSVLECFAEIERLGGSVSHVDPDARGVIEPDAVASAVKQNTALVSVGWANHEIGVVQPIRDIVRAVRDKNDACLVHTDAGQAPLYLSSQVHSLGVDLLSLDAGKLYGPRGIGALYVGSRAELAPVIVGGGQERGLRAGTENVALAAGFAAAMRRMADERQDESKRVRSLRDVFIDGLSRIDDAVVNGDASRSLPHLVNISIPHINSEYVTLALDREGISLSTKSACREGEEARSHVVAVLGGDEWRARTTLRFSFGRGTRERDVRTALDTLVHTLSSSGAVQSVSDAGQS